jgi:hypothetical protein
MERNGQAQAQVAWPVCSDGSWTFTGSVFPGEWNAQFRADIVLALAPSYLTYERSFSFRQGANAVVLDLPVRTISGELTKEGAPIGSPCSDSSPTIRLTVTESGNSQGGNSQRLEVDCSGPNWRFSGLAYPGVYEVSVSGDGEHLPQGRWVAVPRLEVP